MHYRKKSQSSLAIRAAAPTNSWPTASTRFKSVEGSVPNTTQILFQKRLIFVPARIPGRTRHLDREPILGALVQSLTLVPTVLRPTFGFSNKKHTMGKLIARTNWIKNLSIVIFALPVLLITKVAIQQKMKACSSSKE